MGRETMERGTWQKLEKMRSAAVDTLGTTLGADWAPPRAIGPPHRTIGFIGPFVLCCCNGSVDKQTVFTP